MKMEQIDHKFVTLAKSSPNIVDTEFDRKKCQKMIDAKWSLNITSATDSDLQMMKPRTLLQLFLSPSSSSSCIDKNDHVVGAFIKPTCTILDLPQNELEKLYEVVENIQGKMDELCNE